MATSWRRGASASQAASTPAKTQSVSPTSQTGTRLYFCEGVTVTSKGAKRRPFTLPLNCHSMHALCLIQKPPH